MNITFYNSLSRRKDAFIPLKERSIGIYTCGPTVYSYVTIGNWRTYTLADLVVRAFEYAGYSVRYVMNITDVGHLTGDNDGDANQGDDRLEKAAKKEGKTAWDVARYYEKDFLEGFERLCLRKPDVLPRATEHVEEQIALIQKIEEAGLIYKIDDGVYFDVGGYERMGNTYGDISTLDQIQAGARVEFNPMKRDPRDFALWKFSPVDVKRDMEWESPWGLGFPGWHIECSAMSMKYLGEQFDIHLGGEDLRSTHHPNEIVQSESVTGQKPFVGYWMHGAFLTVNGGRMGKSLGNAYTLHDFEERGIDPRVLRYFYFTGHWRQPLNFSWEILQSAQQAFTRLSARYWKLAQVAACEFSKDRQEYWQQQFENALYDDFMMPEVLAVVWKMLQSDDVDYLKYKLLSDWDSVLGFNLQQSIVDIPKEVQEIVDERQGYRVDKDWGASDKLRGVLSDMGWVVEDTSDGPYIRRK